MRKYDIPKLLLSGENQGVEFKEAKNSFPKDGMKTICSFANTNNGLLILGVSENTKNKIFIFLELMIPIKYWTNYIVYLITLIKLIEM